MTSDFAPRLARVLTEYCRPVQPGDYVVINASIEAAPLVEALYEAILRCGGNPVPRVTLPNLFERFLRHANDDQLAFLNPLGMAELEETDVLFSILAESNTKALSSVDPERFARFQQSRRPWIERYLARCEDDDLRWNITAWPTQAAAQDAEMGTLEYGEFVYRACGLHHDDPVAYWTGLRDRQEQLITWLEGKQRCEVRGPGIELSMDLTGRHWINCYGVRNFPDGEIYTCPVEDSVNGYVEFNLPSVYAGRENDGIRLVFRDGAVVEASAAKGEGYLLSQLNMDDGARRLGEFAIGTNTGIDRFTRSILFDEKMGGTIHMALGANANAETGGTNTSAIHWDMVHDMKDGGEIRIDGELFYQNGEFLIAG
jgi:aminopeptidase